MSDRLGKGQMKRLGFERQLDVARTREATLPGPASLEPESHARLVAGAQERFGNEIVLQSLSGALEGPGEMIEGALTLGAGGVQLGSIDGVLANSAVADWMATNGNGEVGAPEVLRHADPAGTEAPTHESDPGRDVDRATSRGGRPLPGALRVDLEARFGGVDFSGVRIHTDAAAAQASEAISAHAFALEADIFFGRGEFQPGSPDGLHLLAHELTHVVQEGHASIGHAGAEGEIQAKVKLGGVSVSSPGDAAEKEAEAVARDVAHTTQSAIGRGSGAVRRLVGRPSGPERSVGRLAGGAPLSGIEGHLQKRLGQRDPAKEPRSAGAAPEGRRPRLDLEARGNVQQIPGFKELGHGGSDGALDVALGNHAKGDVKVERDPEGNLVGGRGYLTVTHPLLGSVDPVLDVAVDRDGNVRGSGAVSGRELELGGVRGQGAIELFVGSDQKLGASGQVGLDLGPGFEARLVPDPDADVFGLVGDIALAAVEGSSERFRVVTKGTSLVVEGTVHAEIAGQVVALTARIEGGRLQVRGTTDGPQGPVDLKLDERGRVQKKTSGKGTGGAAKKAPAKQTPTMKTPTMKTPTMKAPTKKSPTKKG